MTDRMLAYVLTAPGRPELRELPVPVPGPTEALVRVSTASICATDLKIVDGIFPVEPGRVLGHEFVGEVVAVGDLVRDVAVGTRALVHTDTPCGRCRDCLANRNGQGCARGGAINAFHFGVLRDGAHAQYVLVPDAEANVAAIPEGVSDEQAVMLCDVGSTGFSAIEAGEVRFGDVVAVVGQGPVGAAATIGARLAGAALVVGIDTMPQRLERARALGADVVLDPTERDVVAEVRRLTGGEGADVVVEAVGREESFQTAVRLTRAAGVVSTVGNYGMHGELRLPLGPDGFMGGVGNKRIISSTSPGGVDRARRLLSMAAGGRFDLGGFVTHSFPLSEMEAAYELFRSKRDGVFKIAVKP